jgi:hypothetical protein
VPAPVGRLLLQKVLSAPEVRESIAKQAYCVKENQSADAIRVGNLHLRRPQWEADSLVWLLNHPITRSPSQFVTRRWSFDRKDLQSKAKPSQVKVCVSS